MRFGLPLRIALIFLLLTGSGVVGVTYISYLNASNLLEKQSLASLSNDLRRENAILKRGLLTLKEEALFLSQQPAVAGIMRAHHDGYDDRDNLTETSWRQRLGEVFVTVLEQRAPYTQIRFIGQSDHGRELVRVNRNARGVEVVKNTDLQEKGGADYFQRSLALQPGEVYYSRVNYNREHGNIVFPLQPVLRMGVPVFSQDGRIFGALVINVDFQQMAASLYKPLSQARYYLANEHGDYIIHPDKDKQLAFELGDAVKIQQEYPIDMARIGKDAERIDAFSIPALGVGMAAHRLYFDGLNPERFFLIGTVASHEVIRTASLGLAQDLVYVTVMAVLLISLLAAVAARLLTRRLVRLREVADRVASGDEDVEISFSGGDEIGDLARSFKDMLLRLAKSRSQLSEMTASLEHKVQERTQALETLNADLQSANLIAESSARQLGETLAQSESLRIEAQEASTAKSDFLANMSHELRTPLNGIIGMTHFTLESQLTSEQRQQLNTIDASAKALLSLLNDILDVSKVEAGKLMLEENSFDLQTLVDNTVEMHAISAHRKGLELIASVDNAVPIALLGDGDRLRQVMVNMLGNALKFTAEGEVELHVALEARQGEAVSLHFSVRDTGIGIAKDKQAGIFEPFVQADSSITRKYGGTGLGMTISRQIVALMNGRIWIESEEGQGTTFHFIVELKCQPEATTVVFDLSAKLRGLSLLIVDDNASQRRALVHMAAAWGMQTQGVYDGSEAMQVLREAEKQSRPFDLCLLDYQLPIKNGLEIAAEIRHEDALAELKIVLLSHPGDWAGQAFVDLNINASVVKPVKKQVLLLALLKSIGEEEATTVTDEVQALMPETDIPPLNILVAEDNEVNQCVAELALSRLGHQMTLAENGQKALALWQKGGFDLIIMDVQMPEMDGLTATRAIRLAEADNEHIPIIAATAHAMASDRDKCLEAGMDSHISKPLNLTTLGQTIAQVFKAHAVLNKGEPPLYDLSALRELIPGDEEKLKELIQVFVQTMDKNLLALQEALAQADAPQVEFCAHRLKGSAGQLQALAMSEIAAELEALGKAGDLSVAAEKLSAIQGVYQKMKPGLEAEI